MTPAARLSAAASILDSIAQGRQPADAVLKEWGRQNRYAGSKDRRAIADRVYRVIRSRARLVWAMGGREDGRALVIGSLALIDGLPLNEIEALHSGEGYGPKPLSKQERARITAPQGELPGWVASGLPPFVVEDFKTAFGDRWAQEAEALMSPRAPIDLRVNGARATVDAVSAELNAAELSAERTPWSAWGLRLPAEPPPNVQALDAFKAGRLEIQDEGSQIVCWLATGGLDLTGATVVDYCAGGGGKTLGLAAAMHLPSPLMGEGPGLGVTAVRDDARSSSKLQAPPPPSQPFPHQGGRARIIACDVVPRRLDNIRPRLERAGVRADLRLLGPEGEGIEDLVGAADLVLVDAPCSGSGTWRRRPVDAWRLTPEEIERLHALQAIILNRAAALVKPGGRLAYVTCSMLTRENEDSEAAFEAAQPQFRPLAVEDVLKTPAITDAGRARLSDLADCHRLRLSPAVAGTDGFFIALYERAP